MNSLSPTRIPFRALLGALLLFVVTAGLMPGVAHAALRNPTQIVNSDIEDGCLSANFNNDVYITPCTGIDFHKWERVNFTGTGRIWLRNVGTGRCLSANNSNSVYTTACSTTVEYHVWDFAMSTQAQRIINTGNYKCLSASSVTKDVYLVGPGDRSCSGIAAHLWYFS